MSKRVQVHVTGQVQGVGFRYYAVHVAQERGVVGFVRNTHDGGIEVIAEGEEATLQDFVDVVGRGPHTAEVSEATAAWSEPTGEFQSFTAAA